MDCVITPEMIEFFEKRTAYHISLVQKYAAIIEKAYPVRFNGLTNIAKTHDASKLVDPERTPYIALSWRYHCRDIGTPFQVSDEDNRLLTAATEGHVKANSHHPEFHDKTRLNGIINVNDRDAVPNVTINACDMPEMDIAHMVSDWLAMSQERNTDPFEWARKNVNIRWKFTPRQVAVIYDLLNSAWPKRDIVSSVTNRIMNK